MRIATTLMLGLALSPAMAHADVVEFEDFGEWSEAVGPFATIDFTGFEKGTFITDQYQDLGVTFTVGDDWIEFCAGCYLNDGWGLSGNVFGDQEIHVEFSEPMTSIASHFPGFLRFELFHAGRSVYTSTEFGQSGAGHFGGVQGIVFDAVVLDRIVGTAFVDDLHFGPPIPAPPAIALLGAALISGSSGRRRRCV